MNSNPPNSLNLMQQKSTRTSLLSARNHSTTSAASGATR